MRAKSDKLSDILPCDGFNVESVLHKVTGTYVKIEKRVNPWLSRPYRGANKTAQ